jgi:GNAT superfamily N-acetyltransferase
MTVLVRRARPTDAAEVARLYAQLVSNPALNVRPERVAELEASAQAALFVAVHGERLAGTVLVALCLDAMFGHQPFAVVENIVVDADVRGLGVGAALLHAVDRFCLAADCSKIMLLSAVERPEAHAFFERAGYAGDRKRGFVKYRRAFA